jgi:membrane protease YdiL (CAAX protease family)
MREFITRHTLSAYFILACAISWLIWLPLVAAAWGYAIGLLPYHHFYGALGPCLAAFIVTAITGGKIGLISLVQRIVLWRTGVIWYLIALFAPLVLFVLAVAVGSFSTEDWSVLQQFGTSDEFPQFGLLSLWLFHIVTFGFGEEIGWRGFALPRLQQKNSAFVATLILSVFWAIWHIPTFFYRPGYAEMGLFAIVGWFFSIVMGAMLLTWLYNSTRGSVLIVSLFHGSVDIAFTSKGGGEDIMNMIGMFMMVWSIAVILIYRPAHLSAVGKKVEKI